MTLPHPLHPKILDHLTKVLHSFKIAMAVLSAPGLKARDVKAWAEGPGTCPNNPTAL
jgi:hypothetical protein